MKNKDKFGNTIYPSVFRKLKKNGEKLIELGYRESKNKANLFYRKTKKCVFFADMRGTDIIPIWEDTSALFYVKFLEKLEHWEKTRIEKKETDRFDDNGVQYRYSYYILLEPDWIVVDYINSGDVDYFGDGWDFDGYCKVCGRDMERNGFFCSEGCKLAYAYKRVFERLENASICEICGKKMVSEELKKDIERYLDGEYDLTGSPVKHHTSYSPEKIITICPSCHAKIHHSEDPRYNIYRPEEKNKI